MGKNTFEENSSRIDLNETLHTLDSYRKKEKFISQETDQKYITQKIWAIIITGKGTNCMFDAA